MHIQLTKSLYRILKKKSNLYTIYTTIFLKKNKYLEARSKITQKTNSNCVKLIIRQYLEVEIFSIYYVGGSDALNAPPNQRMYINFLTNGSHR